MAGGPTPYDAAVKRGEWAGVEVHRLHKMVHTLRRMLIDKSTHNVDYDYEKPWTAEDVDDSVGVEPECAACHGFGAGPGQEPVPVALTIIDAAMGCNLSQEVLDSDMLPKLKEAMLAAGFNLLELRKD